MRDNSKQVIVDVIEGLNLILVFSFLNNVHYIYRVNQYISEDSQNVNNLLNATGLHLPDPPATEQAPSVNYLNASVHKTLGTPQKRLSVSPIISTHSFYNKLNLNSPLAGYNNNNNNQQQQSQPQQSNLTTSVTTTTTQVTTSTTGNAIFDIISIKVLGY